MIYIDLLYMGIHDSYGMIFDTQQWGMMLGGDTA